MGVMVLLRKSNKCSNERCKKNAWRGRKREKRKQETEEWSEKNGKVKWKEMKCHSKGAWKERGKKLRVKSAWTLWMSPWPTATTQLWQQLLQLPQHWTSPMHPQPLTRSSQRETSSRLAAINSRPAWLYNTTQQATSRPSLTTQCPSLSLLWQEYLKIFMERLLCAWECSRAFKSRGPAGQRARPGIFGQVAPLACSQATCNTISQVQTPSTAELLGAYGVSLPSIRPPDAVAQESLLLLLGESVNMWLLAVAAVLLTAMVDARTVRVPRAGKLLLVSMDGFRWDYLEQMAPLPNFDRVVRAGTKAPYVNNTFVTVTFPTHYTIATGGFTVFSKSIRSP